MLDATQHAFIGRQRRLATSLLQEGVLHATLQGRDDRSRHSVRNGENLGHRAIVGVAPDLRAARGVDKAHCDANALVEPFQTALYEIADSEASPDIGNSG